MHGMISRHDSTSNEPTRVGTRTSGFAAIDSTSKDPGADQYIPDISDETLTSRSSKPIHLEPPPAVVRPPKIKTDSFSHHALSWLSWNRNEHKDVSHCARSTRASYTLEKTFRLFGLTVSQNIAYKTTENGIDTARVHVRLVRNANSLHWQTAD